MVRYFFILLILFFSISLFPLVSYAHGHSQTETKSDLEESLSDDQATESAQEEVEENVKYELSYPGMLPDNPLYFIKTIRDAVVKFLISDPLKKAEFNVLTANKRAYAALLLAEKGKHELALETIGKSNNYLHEAVFSLSEVFEKKQDAGSVLDSLDKSVKKHHEVFSRQIEPIISESMKKTLNDEIKRLEDIGKSVENISS